MNEQDISLLNDYFNGLLPPDAAAAVESRASSDPDFGQEFALRRDMEAFPRRAEARQAFAATLTAVGADYFQENIAENQPFVVRQPSNMRWLAAAASLALLAAALWFFTADRGPSYRQYAAHEQPSFTVRGATDQAAADAEKAFAAADYAPALNALDRLLAERPDDPSVPLYRGICLIELDRPNEARNALEPLATGNSALRSEAQWYLALGYLKTGDRAACRSALTRIQPGETRHEQAQELLKKLE